MLRDGVTGDWYALVSANQIEISPFLGSVRSLATRVLSGKHAFHPMLVSLLPAQQIFQRMWLPSEQSMALAANIG